MMAEVPLSVESIIGLLHKCRQEKSVPQAKHLLTCMRRHQLDTHTVLGNHLVPLLVDCSCLPDARHIFDQLAPRTVYSWTALIAGNVDCGNPHHAFLLHQYMLATYVAPNDYTFVALLKACAQLKHIDRGRDIHAQVVFAGLDNDCYISNTLIDMYGKCGSLSEAHDVFDGMPVQDQISWTALISAYADHSCGESALDCFAQMQLKNIPPNPSTYVCSLKACSRLKDEEKGRAIHAQITMKGLEIGLFIGNTLIDMYGKSASHADARHVFEKMTVQDQVSWAALISGYVECGLGKEALECYDQMQLKGILPNASTFLCSLKACDNLGAIEKGRVICAEIAKRGLQKDVFVGSTVVALYAKYGLFAEAQEVLDQLPVCNIVAWTALIAGYADHQLGEEALNCFKKMQRQGLFPDAHTYACSLKACGMIGTLEIGQEIHAELTKKGMENSLSVANTLVDLYGKCSLLADGQHVFSNMPIRDVKSWTAMIKGYGENHEGNKAVQCFEDMQVQGWSPDSVAFTALLAACSHASLVNKGHKYFKMMKETYRINPTADHYACMVDLLARSGHLGDAEKFAATMLSMQFKEEILSALLSACKNHGEVELGLRCFQHLVEENREDAAAYLLIKDLYASAGRWSEVNKIEEMRQHVGATKKPAGASIEVEKTLHEFIVGINLSKAVSAVSEVLSSYVRDEGFIPNLDLISGVDA